MLIIPAIDLRAGSCVRLTQGRKDATKVYDANPLERALRFQNDGAEILHVVDLDAAFSENNQRNREVLHQLTKTLTIPIQFGGGVRTEKETAELLELGVARVVVGTVAASSIDTLKRMLALGPGSIVVGIDAREGHVLTHGWEKEASISAVTLARRVADLGGERIIYTDVTRDGMMTGPSIEATCEIALQSGLRVTASGGVSSLEDLVALKRASACGIDSVIVGKALYEGRFSLKEAMSDKL